MRLFTFGCSYTDFFWPTWADIIATDLDIEYHNWGISGLGNIGIQSRIVEADFKNKLSSDDLTIIVWSSWCREDRFIDNIWHCGGNIFNNHFYDDHFINKYWSWENDVVKNSTAIHLVNKAYKDVIKFQGSMTAFPNTENNSELTPFIYKLFNRFIKIDDPITEFYKKHLDMPPCWNMTDPKLLNSKFNGNCSDLHPDVNCHLAYVEHVIYPKLGYTLKDSTKHLFNTLHDELAVEYRITDNLDTLTRKTRLILPKYNIKNSSI